MADITDTHKNIINNLTKMGFSDIQIEEYMDNAVLFNAKDLSSDQSYLKIAVTKQRKLYVFGVSSILNASNAKRIVSKFVN